MQTRGTRASLDKHGHDVSTMFDTVAMRYDLTNDVLTGGLDRVWRVAARRAVGATTGERVLDIAAGTGTSSVEYTRDGAEVIAADFSSGMVAEGKKRYGTHPRLRFQQADAMDLPFPDDSFDVTTISYGLRNVHDPKKALKEMARVTRPGGRIVVVEFSHPTWAPFASLYRFFLHHALARIAAVTSSNDVSYTYLVDSILHWPSQEELAHMIHNAGWEKCEWRNLSGGIVAIHRAWLPYEQ